MRIRICDAIEPGRKTGGEICDGVVLALGAAEVMDRPGLHERAINAVLLLACEQGIFSEVFIKHFIEPEMSVGIYDHVCCPG